MYGKSSNRRIYDLPRPAKLPIGSNDKAPNPTGADR